MPFTGNDTATTNFDKTVQEMIARTLYDELRAGLENLPKGAVVPATFGGKGSGGNGTFRFPRYGDLDATPASHTLTEGTPPAGQEMTVGYDEFDVAQSGDFVRISDVSEFQSKHGLAGVAADKVSRQMLELIDNQAKALWAAGDNAIYSGTSNAAPADVAAGDVLLSSDVKRAVALLEGGDVARLTGNAYGGLIHPYVKFDLTLDDDAGGWIDASRYGASEQLLNGELGKYAGVKFIVSSNTAVLADQGTASIDVYLTTILGKQAIAFGDLGTCEPGIVERGGVSDPLHQQMTVGWKAYLGGCIVGEAPSGANQPDPRYVNIGSASSI
jgi:N4-gp56 family major capsid protein